MHRRHLRKKKKKNRQKEKKKTETNKQKKKNTAVYVVQFCCHYGTHAVTLKSIRDGKIQGGSWRSSSPQPAGSSNVLSFNARHRAGLTWPHC